MDSTQTVRTTVVWPDGTPESVGIRGTFGSDPQHWWQETIELRKTAAADKYTVDLDLPPGKYEFKFVINSTDWRINAQMYTSVDDGSGNTNNVLVVPAKSKSSKASSSSHTALSAEQSSDFDTDQQLDPRNDQKESQEVSEQTPLLGAGSSKGASKTRTSNDADAEVLGSRSGSTDEQGEGEGESRAALSEDNGSSSGGSWWNRARRYVICAVAVLAIAALGLVSGMLCS